MEVQRKKVMSRWKYVRQTEQLSHEIFDMLPLIRTSLESWDCLIFYDFFPPFSFFNCSHLTVQPVSFWIRHKCTYARTNKLAWHTVSIFMREKNTAFSSWVKNTIELWRITHLLNPILLRPVQYSMLRPVLYVKRNDSDELYYNSCRMTRGIFVDSLNI